MALAQPIFAFSPAQASTSSRQNTQISCASKQNLQVCCQSRPSPALCATAATAAWFLAASKHRQRRQLRCGQQAAEDGLAEEWEEQRVFWQNLWSQPEDSQDGQEDTPVDLLTRKRVMILISDTGGGHRASAKALADAIEELYPGQIETAIRDVWTEDCPWPFNNVVKQYMWMAKHTWSWRMFWYWSKFPISRWFMQRMANARCRKVFRQAMEADSPDLVISVHPGTQHITLKVLKAMARQKRQSRIPFVTVVTDLGSAHPMWFHPEADRVFVPSRQVRDLALRCGVRESAIEMYGLPLRRAFWKPERRPLEAMRQQLGLEPEACTVLVVGGGDGVGRILQVAQAISFELAEIAKKDNSITQLVVICGKNEKVKQQLSDQRWPPGLQTHFLGFVPNMDEWMAVSDIIVTKAGPGTIAEACTRHLPVMLSSYLPGQEAGNVSFVVDGGFGEYSNDPQVIAKTIAGWLRDPQELERRSKLSKAHGRGKATLQIAKVIGQRWLVAEAGELASALVKAMKESAAKAARGAEEGCAVDLDGQEEADCRADLQAALNTLTEAQRSLDEATAALSDAKIKVRDTLANTMTES